mgnify:CR=1 FL=1
MNKKYLFGGIIVVVFLGMMAFLFTRTNIKYESNFSVLMEKGRTAKATGNWVKEKLYEVDNVNKTFTFYMKDENGKEMKVVYKGSMPNNFETATSVVATGKYQNGCFRATEVLTKCPSKYQEQMKTKTTGI